MVGVVLN